MCLHSMYAGCRCIVVQQIGTFVWILYEHEIFYSLHFNTVPSTRSSPIASRSFSFFLLKKCWICVCRTIYIKCAFEQVTPFIWNCFFLLSVWWYSMPSLYANSFSLSNCNRELIYAEIVIIINFAEKTTTKQKRTLM